MKLGKQTLPFIMPLLFRRQVVSDSFATWWTEAHQAPLSMGILQARILEWVAISYSRGSSQPRDQTYVSCLSSRFFTTGSPGKTLNLGILGGRISTHNTLLLVEQTQSLLSCFVFCFNFTISCFGISQSLRMSV